MTAPMPGGATRSGTFRRTQASATSGVDRPANSVSIPARPDSIPVTCPTLPAATGIILNARAPPRSWCRGLLDEPQHQRERWPSGVAAAGDGKGAQDHLGLAQPPQGDPAGDRPRGREQPDPEAGHDHVLHQFEAVGASGSISGVPASRASIAICWETVDVVTCIAWPTCRIEPRRDSSSSSSRRRGSTSTSFIIRERYVHEYDVDADNPGCVY